jgi:adenosylhomocysteine/aminodeoxyfutalosine nucleosidase
MEGASVALICRELGIPCLVLRSISDTADMEANFDFQKFVNESAEKSAKVIEKLLEKI